MSNLIRGVLPVGIRVTVVEPGFFRTDLLDAHSARYPNRVIDDYTAEGKARDLW